MRTIEHAGVKWNKDLIKSYSEEGFIAQFKGNVNHNTLRNLWKIVHNKSVPNYEVKESKPKRKRIKEESKAKNKAKDNSKS